MNGDGMSRKKRKSLKKPDLDLFHLVLFAANLPDSELRCLCEIPRLRQEVRERTETRSLGDWMLEAGGRRQEAESRRTQAAGFRIEGVIK